METLFFAGQLPSSFYSYEAFHNVHRLYIANFIERNLSHFFEGYIPGFYLPSLLSWGVCFEAVLRELDVDLIVFVNGLRSLN